MSQLVSSPRVFYAGTFVAGLLTGMIVALKWTI
jgi:hypothetical protein